MRCTGAQAWNLFCCLCDGTAEDWQIELLAKAIRNQFVARFVAKRVALSVAATQQMVFDAQAGAFAPAELVHSFLRILLTSFHRKFMLILDAVFGLLVNTSSGGLP